MFSEEKELDVICHLEIIIKKSSGIKSSKMI
jgi:hypothetical protein